MRQQQIFYCPKCGSDDIETVALNPPKPERVSMDDMAEYIGGVRAIPAVIKPTHWRATCKKCGYKKEFTTPVPMSLG